jgi:hypothetical protein
VVELYGGWGWFCLGGGHFGSTDTVHASTSSSKATGASARSAGRIRTRRRRGRLELYRLFTH